jgi:hypothetical protein
MLKRALLAYARTQVITQGDALTSEQLQHLVDGSNHAADAIWRVTQAIVDAKEAGAFDVPLWLAVTDLFSSHRLRNWSVFYSLPAEHAENWVGRLM